MRVLLLPTATAITQSTRMGEKQGSPVTITSRSGVWNKLSVTTEMSTTKCNVSLEVEQRREIRGEKKGSGSERQWKGGCPRVCVTIGLLMCVNGSVEKGSSEQQNKLMDAEIM